MNRKKIAFGKINLKVNIAAKNDEDDDEKTKTVTDAQEVVGFKKMDKQQLQRQVEDVTEDLESQHLKNIMGISQFGKKSAKTFDIEVNNFTIKYFILINHRLNLIIVGTIGESISDSTGKTTINPK